MNYTYTWDSSDYGDISNNEYGDPGECKITYTWRDYRTSNEYDILEEITLELLSDLYKCNYKEAKILLKGEIKKKDGDKFLPKPKEWIDSKLFEI